MKALRNKKDQKRLKRFAMVLNHEDCTRPQGIPRRKDGKRLTMSDYNFLVRVSRGKNPRKYWPDSFWLEEHLDWCLLEEIPGNEPDPDEEE